MGLWAPTIGTEPSRLEISTVLPAIKDFRPFDKGDFVGRDKGPIVLVLGNREQRKV